MPIRFDDSLPTAVKTIEQLFDKDTLESSVFIRDVSGRLSVVVSKSLSATSLSQAEAALTKNLEKYARKERPIAGCDQIGAGQILAEGDRISPINVGGYLIRLIDRRIVGADWMTIPADRAEGIPRLVFSSIKGGVGRSTALSVVCAHLSKRGRRVLAIDCDLEAPGIGAMLLQEEAMPKYGTLDYLVENGISGVDERFMADATGDSYLGSKGARVTVMPAIGRSTASNPADALSKISRAYLEDIAADGEVISLSKQLRRLTDSFSRSGEYDVVVLDARAGLHEMTASVMLGLGAELLLFGVDEPQTYLGYRLLLGHMSRFPINREDDWRDRVHFVHAKANIDVPSLNDDGFNALLDQIYPQPPEIEPEELGEEDFKLEWADNVHSEEEDIDRNSVLHIFGSQLFERFDPVANRSLLDEASYEAPFRELLEFVDALIEGRQ